jgi:hypothetical protein
MAKCFRLPLVMRTEESLLLNLLAYQSDHFFDLGLMLV